MSNQLDNSQRLSDSTLVNPLIEKMYQSILETQQLIPHITESYDEFHEQFYAKFLDITNRLFIDMKTQTLNIIENRPLFVMFEKILNCDPKSDHEAPKNVLPVFQPMLDAAFRQISNDVLTEVFDTFNELRQSFRELLSDVFERQLNENFQAYLEVIRTQIDLQLSDKHVSELSRRLGQRQAQFSQEIKQVKKQLEEGIKIKTYKPDFREAGPKEDAPVEDPNVTAAKLQAEAFARQCKQLRKELDTANKQIKLLMKDNEALRQKGDAFDRLCQDNEKLMKRCDIAEEKSVLQLMEIGDLTSKLDALNLMAQKVGICVEKRQFGYLDQLNDQPLEFFQSLLTKQTFNKGTQEDSLSSEIFEKMREKMQEEEELYKAMVSQNQQFKEKLAAAESDNKQLATDKKILQDQVANLESTIEELKMQLAMARAAKDEVNKLKRENSMLSKRVINVPGNSIDVNKIGITPEELANFQLAVQQVEELSKKVYDLEMRIAKGKVQDYQIAIDIVHIGIQVDGSNFDIEKTVFGYNSVDANGISGGSSMGNINILGGQVQDTIQCNDTETTLVNNQTQQISTNKSNQLKNQADQVQDQFNSTFKQDGISSNKENQQEADSTRSLDDTNFHVGGSNQNQNIDDIDFEAHDNVSASDNEYQNLGREPRHFDNVDVSKLEKTGFDYSFREGAIEARCTSKVFEDKLYEFDGRVKDGSKQVLTSQTGYDVGQRPAYIFEDMHCIIDENCYEILPVVKVQAKSEAHNSLSAKNQQNDSSQQKDPKNTDAYGLNDKGYGQQIGINQGKQNLSGMEVGNPGNQDANNNYKAGNQPNERQLVVHGNDNDPTIRDHIKNKNINIDEQQSLKQKREQLDNNVDQINDKRSAELADEMMRRRSLFSLVDRALMNPMLKKSMHQFDNQFANKGKGKGNQNAKMNQFLKKNTADTESMVLYGITEEERYQSPALMGSVLTGVLPSMKRGKLGAIVSNSELQNLNSSQLPGSDLLTVQALGKKRQMPVFRQELFGEVDENQQSQSIRGSLLSSHGPAESISKTTKK